MKDTEWIKCPICGNKTRLKARKDTILEHFPLFCPKCKKEFLVDLKAQNLSIIREPDA